ncbi:ParA family protein [Mycobacteroides abscessus]|uniref:ParA family protein n=1 Tax=Mycobacteroides abscessus TaxID=36809 RepID=UPI0003862081|nr:ParA family protein [Mycobacteroides abscessus]EPZ18757.1 hypothetical protein M879_19315 [Mycobacteroides abscessus V06705]MDO3268025.1 ParA family protein [Mycobacteroides abscessus subsp. abscessus]SLF48571.1 ATPase involved in chromosome partitioning [Mycobacteroides abscessus subsp. abscessus]
MAHVRTFLSQKGGVGKSTMTVNTSAVEAQVHADPDDESSASSPVACVSVDPQGSAVWWSDRVEDLPFYIIQAHDAQLGELRQLNQLTGIKVVNVDTPGWLDLEGDANGDGLGDGAAADRLRAILEVSDEVIVPMLPEPLCFDPTARTIEKVLLPRNIPFRVVINNWDPRDGDAYLEQTKNFVKKSGWPLARTVIRHYKVHTNASAEGLVVTEYKKNRVALQAAEDFYKLALELNAAGVR